MIILKLCTTGIKFGFKIPFPVVSTQRKLVKYYILLQRIQVKYFVRAN